MGSEASFHSGLRFLSLAGLPPAAASPAASAAATLDASAGGAGPAPATGTEHNDVQRKNSYELHHMAVNDDTAQCVPGMAATGAGATVLGEDVFTLAAAAAAAANAARGCAAVMTVSAAGGTPANGGSDGSAAAGAAVRGEPVVAIAVAVAVGTAAMPMLDRREAIFMLASCSLMGPAGSEMHARVAIKRKAPDKDIQFNAPYHRQQHRNSSAETLWMPQK